MSELITVSNDGQDWVEAYKELATLLTGELAWLKWVDLWDEQPYFSEADHPVPVPAVYLEFNSDAIDEKGDQGDLITMSVAVTLYYTNVGDTFKGSWNQAGALEFAGYLRAIHRVLKGTMGDHFSRMTRTGMQRLDAPHAGGRLYQQVYSTVITDNSARVGYVTDLGDPKAWSIGKGPIPGPVAESNKLYKLD